jgi:hypothetical protein
MEMMTLRCVFAALACLMLFVSSCSVAQLPTPSGGQSVIGEVEVTGHGSDNPDAFCSDFNLTSAAAQRFFARAKMSDAATLHAQFEILPCWVRGTARTEGQPVSWEIRAGGTATVSWPGHTTLLSCQECAGEFK